MDLKLNDFKTFQVYSSFGGQSGNGYEIKRFQNFSSLQFIKLKADKLLETNYFKTFQVYSS